MLCPYCNCQSELKLIDEAFSFEMQQALRIDTPKVWICPTCRAWAGAWGDGSPAEAFGDMASHDWRHEAFLAILQWQTGFYTSFPKAAEHFEKVLDIDRIEVPWLTNEQCQRIVEHVCSTDLQAFSLAQ